MSAIGAAGVDLGLYHGATLAGILGSLVLYGASILQTFIYYLRWVQRRPTSWLQSAESETSYPDDRAWKKLFVAIVFLLETVHSFLACAGIWNYLVQYFGDFANLTVLHPTILVPIVFSSIVAFVVQTYFVWRIRCLSTGHFKQIFPAVMMPLVITQLALGCYYVANALMTPTITVLYGPLLTKVGDASLGIAAVIDTIIATAMLVLLGKGRNQSNKHTDRILFRWTLISIHTGFWTASFAVLTVVLHALYPSNLLLTAVYFPICELYCNTLLANFNARSWVRQAHGSSGALTTGMIVSRSYHVSLPFSPLAVKLNISTESSTRMNSASRELFAFNFAFPFHSGTCHSSQFPE
ncbi:hypothetical protein PAXINDRAFT_19064 [Paxillus involutus ATCC 200175]|uniref:DUF6534 domain-containing protein n=1 Tax=Paxillus involutus ATCC 200175 TaxID=664439 RepID=A0A0C9SXM3_PAXIN|nr:hypothetical protein PAXINDRAFT_19064 [Paxillus involutus ATCC 200175]